MKISCPTCAAKYSVADEKIQSRLAKIRCRKCSATIVIDGMTTPASVYIGDPGAPLASGPPPQDTAGEGVGARPSGASPSGPAAAASPVAAAPAMASPLTSAMADPLGPAADEYAVDIADNDQRNMTIHQIVGAYNEGLITADTYIWKEGMADWQTLAEVKAVADAIQAAARPVAPAAVRRAEQGSGPDLFGRIATAGGEDDISTSAPEPTFSAGTGARNESSVLFSLSALTGSTEAAAAPAAGGGKSGRKNSEDSGLIDLTALTASDASAGGGLGASASAYGASPLISAPLGGVSGPSLGAGLAPGYGAPRSSGRTLIVAASVLAVAILGGAGLLVLNRGGGDVEPTTPLAEPAAAPAGKQKPLPEPEEVAANPAPTKEKETEPASVKENTVSPDELPAAPEPVAKPVAARPAAPKPKPAPAPAPAPVRAKPAPAPAPEPVAAPPKPAAEPPKKPAGPRCDCKPADLMCAMRCSAKK